ncbi:hypothetical protein [Paenibacillus montanisoli]|uniref:Uncharacterized protein n=1 Tax=Paenibacillus montanisoli TaxID=2081970 RepID=A0A328U4V2_9BACL|nr:hypothetical protein [Paenibacillus montanisoli]RAP77620.1 hypothetical protein DL346_03865 [Paenibacillus montanisoli]
MLRSFVNHAAYLAVSLTTSFVFYWVFKIWISMGRFTAADAPPGDISDTEKVFYSFVVPIVYGVLMTLLSFMYRRYLMKYSVKLSALFIFAIHTAICVYFITQFRTLAFS